MRAYAVVKTKNHSKSWVIKYIDLTDDDVVNPSTFGIVDTPNFKLRWAESDLEAYEYLKTLCPHNIFSQGDSVLDTSGVTWSVEIVNENQSFVILNEHGGDRQVIATIDGRPSIFCPIEYVKR